MIYLNPLNRTEEPGRYAPVGRSLDSIFPISQVEPSNSSRVVQDQYDRSLGLYNSNGQVAFVRKCSLDLIA